MEKVTINTDIDYGTSTFKKDNLKSKIVIGKEQQIIIYTEKNLINYKRKCGNFY